MPLLVPKGSQPLYSDRLGKRSSPERAPLSKTSDFTEEARRSYVYPIAFDAVVSSFQCFIPITIFFYSPMRATSSLLPVSFLLLAFALPELAGAQTLPADTPHPAYLRVGLGRTEATGTTYHSARAFVEYAQLLGVH